MHYCLDRGVHFIKSAYSPPKHIFPLYISSSLHLKVKHKIPLIVKSLFVLIPLFFALIWFLVQKVKADHFGKTPSADLVAASGVPALGSASGVPSSSNVSEGKINKYLEDFTPVVPGRPDSSPAYDSLRKVAVMPRISACVEGVKSCICYSQRGTRFPEVSDLRCREILKSGFGFDPYYLPVASEPSKPLASPVHPVASARDDSPMNLSDYQTVATTGKVYVH